MEWYRSPNRRCILDVERDDSIYVYRTGVSYVSSELVFSIFISSNTECMASVDVDAANDCVP